MLQNLRHRGAAPWACAIACCAAALVITPAASAGHVDRVTVISRSHHHDGCRCDICAPPRISFAQREFTRGQAAGRRTGLDAGYADGRRGARFDDRLCADFRGASVFYRDGFVAGYRDGYRDGFDRGRDECRPRFSFRWRWW